MDNNINNLMSLRAASLEGLAGSSLDGEELIVANLSTFAQLLQSNHSGLDQILTKRPDLLSLSCGRSIGINSLFHVIQNQANNSVSFCSAPQILVGLADLSVEISRFFQFNVLTDQVQVVGIDGKDLGVIKRSTNKLVEERLNRGRDSSSCSSSSDIDNLKLRTSENQTVQVATVVVQQSDFVITFAVLQNVDIQRTDGSIGSRSNSGAGIKIGKNKGSLTTTWVENNVGDQITSFTI